MTPDKSDRSLANLALLESEARTRAILDAAVDAIITIDERGTVESMNPAAERLFGYPSAEVIGKNVKMLMPDPYRDEHDGYLKNYRDTGIKKIIGIGREVTGLRKDGSQFPMHLAVSELHLGERRMFTGIARDITDLTTAVRELQYSEARTRAILNAAVDAIMTIDQYGTVESMNPAAEKLFGYATEEVIGRNVKMLMPDPYRGEHDGYLVNYLTTGHKKIIGIGREVIGLRKDGSQFPMHLAVSELKMGNQRMFTGIARDITDMRQAISSLQDSESRTRAVLDAAVDAILTIETDGRVESMNPAAERLFGYKSAEVLGKNVKMLMPDPYRTEHDGYLDNYLKTGVKKIIGIGREVIGLRKDGSRFPMHLAVSELVLGDRRMFTGIARDISDVRHAIQQLEESEARTRTILETAVDAIITIDARGSVESMNPAAEKLFGYPSAEVIGKNVKMLMPDPYRDEHDGYLRNYLTTGQKKIIGIGREVVGLRKDGSTFPMDLAVSEVKLGHRQLFTGIVRDITDRKKTEKQLMFYADEIQGRNQELLRSNQELDEFAYIASHDLKEPLRGIHNYATFLLEDYQEKLNEDGVAKLETLKRLTQRMDVLLDSLLEFSRVGRQEFAIRPSNLDELVAEVIDSLKIVLDERNVELRIPRSLPVIHCDRVRLGEVFRNLITNSMKYNDKPERWIEIGYTTELTPEQLPPAVIEGHRHPMTFYVRDNGIGIPQKFHDAIFKIFKRLHARDEFGGGTGVGLTIVKKIIERHGGQIWIHSQDGIGTTFYFTLAGE
ncbi:MAG: PAS domain S-box protein [Planctomycetia bacterium]|nr:PAS domain S-box protein [Planctomycetia bacterium]